LQHILSLYVANCYGDPHDLRDISDIALRGDGTVYISSYTGSAYGQVYELDRSTGVMILSHSLGTDYLAGITFSSDALGGATWPP